MWDDPPARHRVDQPSDTRDVRRFDDWSDIEGKAPRLRVVDADATPRDIEPVQAVPDAPGESSPPPIGVQESLSRLEAVRVYLRRLAEVYRESVDETERQQKLPPWER